jgi:protein SCO1/2
MNPPTKTVAGIALSVSLAAALPADQTADLTLPAAPPANPEGSVYDLASRWRDQDGKEVLLRDLGDRVRVVVMGYTTCEFACPQLIAELVSIGRELADDPAVADVGFAFVSIDPANDTPEQLKRVERQYGFASGPWKLLTGDADGALELAVTLGMKFRKTDAGEFAHSNIITVLRRDGTIAHQQVGLGQERSATLAAVRAAVADR